MARRHCDARDGLEMCIPFVALPYNRLEDPASLLALGGERIGKRPLAARRQRRPTVLVSGEDAREVAAGEALLRREEARDAAGTLANGIEEVERTKRLLAARGAGRALQKMWKQNERLGTSRKVQGGPLSGGGH